MEFEPVIGIEVHAQLNTNTKAWCNCELTVSALENHRVCEICSAQPGTLPVVNRSSIHQALKIAYALDCKTINDVSYFDRKNYFYPDLPKGYQITQFHKPIAEDGELEGIGIERVQLEEDTGKSTHEKSGDSLINLNRAGTPLVEIVSKPFESGKEGALNYLRNLHLILKYIEVCKGNMQDGNFRCDVNLSLRKKGTQKFGTRTEVKNLNSFKAVEKAIDYEMQRQALLLKSGKPVLQQTLLFDIEKNATKVLRTKSDADDYRYYLEPDLLPLIVTEEDKFLAKNDLPELPKEKNHRFQRDFSLNEYNGDLLSKDPDLANYFEEACKSFKGEDKNIIANWVLVDLLALVKEAYTDVTRIKVKPEMLSTLVNSIVKGAISGKIAKDVLIEMFDTGKDADSIISDKGLKQNSNAGELEEIAQKLIESYPNEVEQLKAGKDRVLGFFVGQVMKQTKGQANPKMTSDIFKKLLGL